MTKEEIIEMARQAGAMFDHITWVERDLLPVFERFAVLVAQYEREACIAHAMTSAEKRTWVGLTAKEKHEFRYSHMTTADFIEDIEAKLKQKNGYAEEKNT